MKNRWITALLLGLALTAGLCACGGEASHQSAAAADTPPAATEPSVPPSPPAETTAPPDAAAPELPTVEPTEALPAAAAEPTPDRNTPQPAPSAQTPQAITTPAAEAPAPTVPEPAPTPAPEQPAPQPAAPAESTEPELSPTPAQEVNDMKLTLTIGGQTFSATLLDNDAARALADRLPLTLDMSELNGNEKYFYLDGALPTNAVSPGQIHTGDLMLFGDNCLVLFYESFSTGYRYTRLGQVDNPAGLAAALGQGSCQVTFRLD